jgi:hypothetical protein
MLKNRLIGALITGAILLGGFLVIQGLITWHQKYVNAVYERYQIDLLYRILIQNQNNCKNNI